MPVLAPAIGAAVAFLTSPMGLAIIGGIALAVVGGLLMKSFEPAPAAEAAQTSGVSTEVTLGEDVDINAIYGRALMAGHLVYHHTYGGTTNDYIQLVYVVGTGRHDSLEKVLVDQVDCPLTGSNGDTYGYAVGGEYAGLMNVKFYSGTLAQTADAGLVANSAGRWTSQHRLAGHSYVIVTMKYDEDVFNSNIPRFGFQIKGLHLYDWRKDSTQPGGVGAHRWNDQSTWEWTDNPAVCLYNYKRGLYLNGVRVLGQGVSDFDINLPLFTAAANLSEESVLYPETGNTLERYTVDCSVTDGATPQSIVRMFESAMSGYGTEIGGAYGPLPAQQQTSVATITDDDIVVDKAVNAALKMAPSDTYNAVQGLYSDMSNNWEQTAYGMRKDAAVEALEGGRRLAVLDLPFITNIERAQMHAEILRRRDRYQANESLVVGSKFYGLEPGDLVTRVKPLFGTKTMLVTSTEKFEDKTSQIILREFNNAVVPGSGDAFIVLPRPVAPPVGVPTRLTTVVGLVPTAISLLNVEGSTRAGIKVVWDPILDPTVSRVLIRYWPTDETETEAQQLSVESKLSQNAVVLTGLLPLTDYTIKATIVTDPARATVWTTDQEVTTLEEVVLAEVADGSIDAAKLSAELLAERGFLVGGGEGSLAERLFELERRQEQAALDALVDQSNRVSTFKITKAQVGASLAAIAETRRLVVTETTALAQLIDEVATEIAENLTAGGLFQITSEVDLSGPTAKADILMKVRAQVGDAFAEAAIRLAAEADGLGNSLSYIDLMADRLRFVTTAGDVVSIPFKIETISGTPTVVVQSMRFRDLKSLDGTTIVLNGLTGFFSITIP